MKKNVLALAMAVLCVFNVHAQDNQISSLSIGSDIPLADVTLNASNSKPVSLQQVRTKNGLLVMFSCNTCPYVIKSQQRTLEMMKEAKAKDIGMVIINSNEAYRDKEDAPGAMKAYAKSQEYTVPYLIDKNAQLADAFGATRTPEIFLFDGNGKLVYKGAMEDNPANPSESREFYLKSAMDKTLSGQSVDPNSTKSIGCTIKRKK